jgi:pyruvate kinase
MMDVNQVHEPCRCLQGLPVLVLQIHRKRKHGSMEDLSIIRSQLEALEGKMSHVACLAGGLIGGLYPGRQESARNLLHYLCLRAEDLRVLQDLLHEHGLSSLASAEGHIRRQLQAVLQRLGKEYPSGELSPCSAEYGHREIRRQAIELFGEKRGGTIPWIMVTCDPAMMADDARVGKLLQHGMNVARINCAHDDEAAWSAMIAAIRRASDAVGLPCRIYMDLAGPKLRTLFPKKGKTKLAIEEGGILHLVEQHTRHKTGGEVACSLPGIVPRLGKGHRVLFDDGTIEALVEEPGMDRATLRIVRISAKKPILKAEKGINFPDTSLALPSLTEFDRKCLPFVAAHADLVGYSFVETESGLEELQRSLRAGSTGGPSIILKIERAAAVSHLPGLLLQGMKEKAVGVMIARGDLAIEIGFLRMSEIQEEILWLCEAAHVPVIWATQVLDHLNKLGMPTRSEITDAVYAAGAECVMINKGGHLTQVIDYLRDIHQRSLGHHWKKRHLFRSLSIAREFMDGYLHRGA